MPQNPFKNHPRGRGSVLTEYEPMGPHGGTIHGGFCSESWYVFSQNYATTFVLRHVGGWSRI